MSRKAYPKGYWGSSGLRAHLRKLRGEFGMTLADMEREGGYSASSFDRWEKGYDVPPVAALVDWALVFGHRLCLVDFDKRSRKPLACPDKDCHREGFSADEVGADVLMFGRERA